MLFFDKIDMFKKIGCYNVDNTEDFISVKAASKIVGINYQTFMYLVNANFLPSYSFNRKKGTKIFLKESEIKNALLEFFPNKYFLQTFYRFAFFKKVTKKLLVDNPSFKKHVSEKGFEVVKLYLVDQLSLEKISKKVNKTVETCRNYLNKMYTFLSTEDMFLKEDKIKTLEEENKILKYKIEKIKKHISSDIATTKDFIDIFGASENDIKKNIIDIKDLGLSYRTENVLLNYLKLKNIEDVVEFGFGNISKARNIGIKSMRELIQSIKAKNINIDENVFVYK